MCYTAQHQTSRQAQPATLKVRLDSGASENVLDAKWTKNLCVKKAAGSHKWNTPSGGMTTNKTTNAQFTIPGLQDDKLIEWDWHGMKNLARMRCCHRRRYPRIPGYRPTLLYPDITMGREIHAIQRWRLRSSRSLLYRRTSPRGGRI